MNRTALGLAVGAGYFLGRTKKLKLAFAVGSLVAGKRLNLTPKGIADLVSQQLRDNPQFKEIGDQLRQDLRGVGKAASGAMVERQIDALADRLHGRTAEVRDQLEGLVPGEDADDEADDEADEEYEEPQDAEEDEEPQDAAADDEDEEEEEEEEPPRKTAAKKAPAKKTAKKAPAKKAPAKKAPARTPAAKKTASAGRTGTRTAAKTASGTASRARRPKGGGDR
ncbi:DNA primase [Streptomyces cacaoi]|uniref:DNA primase n=1 Tax=Streptomyces cacaoi TaxID=1898 RepID=UPI003748C9CE